MIINFLIIIQGRMKKVSLKIKLTLLYTIFILVVVGTVLGILFSLSGREILASTKMSLERRVEESLEEIEMQDGELKIDSDFYRYFDAMKNNINIFFYAECEDIEDFFPILERDWKASHTMFIGVQNYDLRREHPDIDPTVCLYFARLLADVGKYFERGNVEFAKEY